MALFKKYVAINIYASLPFLLNLKLNKIVLLNRLLQLRMRVVTLELQSIHGHALRAANPRQILRQ